MSPLFAGTVDAGNGSRRNGSRRNAKQTKWDDTGFLRVASVIFSFPEMTTDLLKK